ncbi:FHA domain-containing protein [Paenibacillus glycanilyticus]|uniref:DUF6382 domain-containing protein n=1 Tax=Paenibacillus glycanilyticus TaxID=126569 RepID=UPI00203F7022|nr:DUF6382 domain-containing protein [Paenibacillus glycanilyticus]MCM3628824.1 FHA domain-containing protein [Paenibacillus glycanilyticus]
MRQPFRIDFSMNRGHEMIVDRKDGIRRDELDDLELQMLQSGKIPHLLPVEWLEIDGRVTFRYALAGRKMLLHRLQVQPLAMEQFYTLLLGVVEAFEECKHYMLRPEGCLLEDQYLFVGEQLNDIAVAYVPLKEGQHDGVTGSGDLLSLVVRWTAYIQDIDGAGLQRILQPLNGSKWPLAELRSVLLGLIGDAFIQTTPKQVAERVPLIFPDAPVAREPEIMEPKSMISRTSYEPIPQANSSKAASMAQEIPLVEMEEQDPETANKKIWLTAAVVVIAVACVWKYIYLSSHSQSSLYISLGLTLMGMAALYLVLARRLPAGLLAKEVSDDEDEEFVPESQPLGMWPRYEDEVQKEMMEPAARAKLVRRQETELYAYAGNTADLRSKQAISAESEATVLLAERDMEPGKRTELALYREWAGGGSWIEWRDEKFTIGRLGEQVSYEEEAHGISRLHLELEKDGGSYLVKDLGSRNGSMLNGEAMIPYKSYPFVQGDIIQLAGMNGPKYELKTRG